MVRTRLGVAKPPFDAFTWRSTMMEQYLHGAAASILHADYHMKRRCYLSCMNEKHCLETYPGREPTLQSHTPNAFARTVLQHLHGTLAASKTAPTPQCTADALADGTRGRH